MAKIQLADSGESGFQELFNQSPTQLLLAPPKAVPLTQEQKSVFAFKFMSKVAVVKWLIVGAIVLILWRPIKSLFTKKRRY